MQTSKWTIAIKIDKLVFGYYLFSIHRIKKRLQIVRYMSKYLSNELYVSNFTGFYEEY